MMTETSNRFGLPLLAAAQAQKEITHNEAITLIDLLITPVVQSIAPASVPTAPLAGQSWIVGAGATGDWAGKANKIAGWTLSGWRFITPVTGMSLWSLADSQQFQFDGTIWAIATLTGQQLSIGGNKVVGARQGAIANPVAGSSIDTEARSAIAAILSMLRTHGLIAT
jgi:Protein of unknown function (DUF2793)